MNNLFKQVNAKLKTPAAQLEFWIVNGFIIIALLLNIIDVIRVSQSATITGSVTVDGFQTNAINYISTPLTDLLFYYLVIFIIYLMLCFYVAPAFEHKEDKASNTPYIFLLITGCLVTDIISPYVGGLIALKILIIYFNRNKRNKQNVFYYDVALAFALWMLALVFMFYIKGFKLKYYVFYAMPAIMAAWLLAIHWVLPQTEQKRHPRLAYFWRMLLINIVSTLLLTAVTKIMENSHGFDVNVVNQVFQVSILLKTISDELALTVVLGNFFSQLAIIPFARAVYKKRNAVKDEEILALKTELGQSDANLNFLKSQINPHFLFNALNTLYGTALQEDADRTSEGIQKLGDMMRFMLQENTQDKIFLSRDIDYLKNYILLQKLRTSTSPAISIETQITDYTGDLMIAPMLLIPFVENAFKHGISLQNPSYIKITLQTRDNTLYFDVHNSIHIRNDNDPEKGQSGIGLENVKQRLALLYPNRHDLSIRENATEFFIHVTLQLDSNS